MNNRAERQIFFLVVWLTMFSCISAHGQNYAAMPLNPDFLALKYPVFEPIQASRNFSFKMSDAAVKWSLTVPVSLETMKESGGEYPGLYINPRIANLPPGSLYSQPSDLYYIQSGFFCKREWEMEKVTHIPFRFRLGSLADCNALEGKH